MPRRIAAVMSLLVFAVCLIAGIEAENTLATTLSRALVAMAGTLVVGLIVGAMAQKMLDEQVAARKAAGPAAPADGVEANSASPDIPQRNSAGRDR